MAKRISQSPTVTFQKGLISEANDLSFPEGSSTDEDNMSILRNGTRRRRLGLAYEEEFELGPTSPNEAITSVSVWENAGGAAGLNFIVHQINNTLHFYKESSGALSANKEDFTVNLSLFNRPSGFGASTVPIQTASLEGILVVASSELDTFRVDYDDNTNTFSTEVIKFRFRDFTFQGEASEYYEETSVATTTDGRIYDTQNAGWNGERGSAALDTYISDRSQNYPPLNLPWYTGKNADGDYRTGLFTRYHAGTSLIPNGSYILDLYEQDREAESGIAGLNTPETSRFKTVVAYAGRMFYAGASNDNSDKIYFSRVLYQNDALGDCFQRNDPTAEVSNDLLDDDGGVIQVKGAYNIRKLHVLGPFLLVFAENGIWYVQGVDDVFRASEYSINKVSEVGLGHTSSFVSAQGRPYWWSNYGIHTVVSNESGGLAERNISSTTIQTYWNDIGASNRASVKATYDEIDNRIMWFYASEEGGALNKVLIFDETFAAFFPWTISESVNGQEILDPFFISGRVTESFTFFVVTEEGDQIVDSEGNFVVVTKDSRSYIDSSISLFVRDTTGQVTVAKFSDTSFRDWGDVYYDSFIEGSSDFLGNLSTRKVPKYLTTFLSVTEEAYSGSESTGYTLVRPSSCLVSSFWDFNTRPSNTPQQAYRLKRLAIPSGEEFDYPKTVNTSRLRLRGRGRSVRIKFESEQGKDFHLLGYDAIDTVTDK